jgi:magnesium-transporting ATPase (P-type)
MTGDGINDAPALKKADVGFSMGSGSEIARDAGDIVVLDNNLLSIARAVLYGRTIFKSIRKFITFQLTMNLCAVGVSLFGQFLGVESPITVIQMLWVNMIMDTLGGLAFAGEYPLKYYMKERPIGREEPILSGKMLSQILIMGGFGTLLCTIFLKSDYVRAFFGYESNEMKMLTAFFGLFIFTGLAICFTARSERLNLLAGISKNKAFLCIMALIVAVQLLMLYYGGATFRCVGLSLGGLLLVNACSLTVIPADIFRRCIMKLFDKRV